MVSRLDGAIKMKRILLTLLVTLTGLFGSNTVWAWSNVGVVVGVPVYSPAPVYYAPAPVYYAPAPVYAPVYVAPPLIAVPEVLNPVTVPPLST